MNNFSIRELTKGDIECVSGGNLLDTSREMYDWIRDSYNESSAIRKISLWAFAGILFAVVIFSPYLDNAGKVGNSGNKRCFPGDYQPIRGRSNTI